MQAIHLLVLVEDEFADNHLLTRHVGAWVGVRIGLPALRHGYAEEIHKVVDVSGLVLLLCHVPLQLRAIFARIGLHERGKKANSDEKDCSPR